jgi:hypothetical protein
MLVLDFSSKLKKFVSINSKGCGTFGEHSSNEKGTANQRKATLLQTFAIVILICAENLQQLLI